MAKFRKRPIEIEAEQWVPGKYVKGVYFGKEITFEHVLKNPDYKPGYHGYVHTLEGGHLVTPGDWIITGVHGEQYACKPDVFEKTYERVEE